MRPDIAAALDARLGAWADSQGIPVAWDNVQFEPQQERIYLTAHDMPATPYSVDLAHACIVFSGVYQVNVVVPVGTGRTHGKALAAQIATLFPEGQEIPGSGFTCWINSIPAVYPGITNGTTYTIPVSMGYRADIVR